MRNDASARILTQDTFIYDCGHANGAVPYSDWLESRPEQSVHAVGKNFEKTPVTWRKLPWYWGEKIKSSDASRLASERDRAQAQHMTHAAGRSSRGRAKARLHPWL